ncbi:MAG: VPLPA-CTERM sorting domain-containing protein [Paracoccaceae bacterium]
MNMRITAAVAALALGVAGQAGAATVTSLPGAPASTANPAATSTTGTVYQGITGDWSGVYLSPFSDTTTAYTSVSGGASATYDFGAVMSAISLVWGTVDSYNYIDFIKDGVVVETLGGSGIAGGYLQIASDFLFDSVTLRSGSNAFEFGALSATPSAVPVPAAGLLLAGAVAGLGALSRRRRAA